MAEASRSKVTITLGRSGQVVKRAGPVLDSSFSDSQLAIGSKRSIKDRLGSNLEESNLKRHRGDGSRLSLSAIDTADDICLGKDDLRFKIMRKNISKGVGLQNGMDLREILSRPPAQPPPTGLGGRQRMPEPRDSRRNLSEPRDGSRQSMFEQRDGTRQPMFDRRASRQPMYDSRDTRQPMFEARETRQPHTFDPRDRREPMFDSRDDRHIIYESRGGRQMTQEPKDVRKFVPEPNNSGIMRHLPPMRSADALSPIDSQRNSSWTLDHLRRRSPNRISSASRVFSPPRSEEEGRGRGRPSMRTMDDDRARPYMSSKGGLEFSRPMNTASFMTRPSLPSGPAKTVAPLPAPPHSMSSILQKSSYTVDEQLTVDGFLHSLGLEKFVICFKAEEVDMTALRQMGDNDLKELGIPMGPRKKILLALMSRFKR